MRIIFPTMKFYPVQSGGPIYTLFWHCSELLKQNIDVKIISTTEGFDTIKGVQPNTNILLHTDFGDIIYYSGKRKLIKQLVNLVRNCKSSDFVHLNSFFSPISFLSFLALTIFSKKTKIVWSTRGELSRSALRYNSFKKVPILLIIKPLTKRVMFHVTSVKERNEVDDVLGKRNIICIPNLIRSEQVAQVEKEKILLFIGRIHPIKCIENLIEAVYASELFKDSGYKLIIAGKYEDRFADYYKDLRKRCTKYNLTNQIVFVSHITGKEKSELFARSRFTFLPSLTENFGNVVVESLQQGTPVVASRGTPWEELVRFGSGFHISNSPDSLAKIIDEIILMPETLYSDMCHNAIRHVNSTYSIESRISDWLRIYST